MKKISRCLCLVPALAALALPSIASADPGAGVQWSKNFTVFDTSQDPNLQSALDAVNAIPGLNLAARATANMDLTGGMWTSSPCATCNPTTFEWFDALPTASLSASSTLANLRFSAAPGIEAYAEAIPPDYRAEIVEYDFSGNITYLVPMQVAQGALSYSQDKTIGIPNQTGSYSTSILGATITFSYTLVANVVAHADTSVDPVNGLQVNASARPTLTFSTTATSGPASIGAQLTVVADHTPNAPASAANVGVSASVKPAIEPYTTTPGFCLEATGTYGLANAMQVTTQGLPVAGVGGYGPGDGQTWGTEDSCWSPVDGAVWNQNTGGHGAWYGSGLLGSLNPTVTTGSTSGGSSSSSGGGGGGGGGGGSGGSGTCGHKPCLI